VGINKKNFIFNLIYFIFQIILSNVCFANSFYPLGFAFAIVRVFYNGNIFFVIFSYLISQLNFIFLFSDLFICFYEIVIISLYYYIKNFHSQKKPLLKLELFISLAFALKFYYALSMGQNLVIFSLDLFLSLLAGVYFYFLFKAYKNKFLFFKFSNFDYFYFLLIILLLMTGIYSFQIEKLYLEYFLICLIIILSSKILPNDKFFILTMAVGVGTFFASKNHLLLLFSIFLSVICVIIKNRNKLIFILSIIISIILFYLVNQSINYISLLFCLFALIIFAVIKEKFIKKLSNMFEIDCQNIIGEVLQFENINQIKTKLNLMSQTLKNMQQEFKLLIVGKINRDKACEELSKDIIGNVCKRCENFNNCFYMNINKSSLFENLLNKAIVQGKISKDDVVYGLQTYCNKENIIVSEINQIAEVFLKYEKEMKTEDFSKLIISDELENFSKIFANFAKFIKSENGFNKPQSLMLKEQLINQMLSVNEVLVIENITGIESINVIAKNEDLLKREFVSCISNFARYRFKLDMINHLSFSGLGFARFVPDDKLKINIAVSTKAKEATNGDNVSMAKLSKNKYFIALADGMGHGGNANKISSMVLSLIKSMFQIGFDEELVVDSINKLIIPAGIDNFTTLDACVLDLDREIATFIKLGASVSVIKHKNTSEMIECKSLPLGVIEKVTPTIVKRNISAGDFIILASDGVVDSFNNIEDYKCYINDSKILNLQKFVDDVVLDARFQNQKHQDDMTLIAINLLKNY